MFVFVFEARAVVECMMPACLPCQTQAMALQHLPGVIEVATNLTAYNWRRGSAAARAGQADSSSSHDSRDGVAEAGAGPDEVAAAIAAHAARLGLPSPGPGYTTSKTPQQLLALTSTALD
jgi:methylphosphotriester-DNA--protein-cysteine methyltransferase